MEQSPLPSNSFETACHSLGKDFQHIARARAESGQKLDQLKACVADLKFSESTAFVVFGSLARRESTKGSDVDWTLLVDGPSSLDHYKLMLEIQNRLEKGKFTGPGNTGTFGGLISSHDLLHHIGGIHDTNLNMTRRLLLLLESKAVEGDFTRELVIRGLLARYIEFGAGVAGVGSEALAVPRFLLNDFVRLWRTFAVDYAAKKWLEGDKKWALRNAKLRLSRKLIFVKGLLMCLHFHLFPTEWPWSDLMAGDEKLTNTKLASGIRELVDVPAIDLVCQTCLSLGENETLSILLTVYDQFLGLLSDDTSRKHLEQAVAFEDAGSDPVFEKVQGMGRTFRDGLDQLFFDCPKMEPLTRKYGVF